MDTNKKTSTDPQENEIDSNILGGPFRKMFGDTSHEAKKEAEAEDQDGNNDEQTVDEEQDPANK